MLPETRVLFAELARKGRWCRVAGLSGRHGGADMKVRDILQAKGRQVYTVSPDETVQDAVRVLMAHRIGALLVVDVEGVTRGIITERDVLRECLDGADRLDCVPIRTAMTTDIVVGLPDDEIDYAMGLMTQHRIRHLPIMDGGRLAGMISIGDAVKVSLDETSYENGFLREYINGR
jgi:CBS domain-containing protein